MYRHFWKLLCVSRVGCYSLIRNWSHYHFEFLDALSLAVFEQIGFDPEISDSEIWCSSHSAQFPLNDHHVSSVCQCVSFSFICLLFDHFADNKSLTKKGDGDPNAGESSFSMQKSKSSTNVGQVFSKKIWKSRSKSQTRPDAIAQAHWTPQVRIGVLISIWDFCVTSNCCFLSTPFTRWREIVHGYRQMGNACN